MINFMELGTTTFRMGAGGMEPEMLLKQLGKHAWMLPLMPDFHQICVRHV